MTNSPAVSVLMPAYNAAQYIDEAIASICSQTFTDFELIILDDCSTDNTYAIIENWAQKDKRIKTYQNKSNVYIAQARNILIKKSSGTYIAWADADDISLPQRLEHQFGFMECHKDVGILGGFLDFYDGTTVTSIRKYEADDREIRKNIFKFSPVAQPAAMIRRECFAKVGEYNVKYPPAEDIDMSFRIGSYYKFANLQEPIIKYRSYETSATFTRLKKIELSTLEVRFLNRKNPQYHVSFSDIMYNLLHFVSIYIIPSKLKITLFNYIRNSTKEV